MNSMLKSTAFILPLIFSILLIACKKEETKAPTDPCTDESIGEYTLLQSSHFAVPYQYYTTITFKDGLGNTMELDFSMEDVKKEENYQATIQKTCPSNASTTKNYKAKLDAYGYEFKVQPDNNVLFWIGKRNGISSHFEVWDELNISMNKDYNENEAPPTMQLLINQRELPDEDVSRFNSAVSQFTLRNKTFKDVFISHDSSFYYNYEKGFVGFRDAQNVLWVYDTIYVAMP